MSLDGRAKSDCRKVVSREKSGRKWKLDRRRTKAGQEPSKERLPLIHITSGNSCASHWRERKFDDTYSGRYLRLHVRTLSYTARDSQLAVEGQAEGRQEAPSSSAERKRIAMAARKDRHPVTSFVPSALAECSNSPQWKKVQGSSSCPARQHGTARPHPPA